MTLFTRLFRKNYSKENCEKDIQLHNLVFGPTSAGKTSYKVQTDAVAFARKKESNDTNSMDITNSLNPLNPIHTTVNDDDLIKTGGSSDVDTSCINDFGGSDCGSCTD
ncbi:hypothetical protein [Bacillus sp. NPDC094106]|uniref:hypothetical protein n=1 Tax=Bacillus sp. NPDC094106 TaxID=3363949 RepID=UPI0038019E1B